MIRKHRLSLFIFLYVFIFIPTLAQQDRTIRLLIIGNSFSGNASRYLPQLAQEHGTNLIIGRAELGGCSLERHWSIVEAYEADHADPKGKQYKGKSLKMLLEEADWDYVTIQQNSMNSTDLETYKPYARNLYDYIRRNEPGAEIVLHQTWAYRIDSKDFGRINAQEHTKSAKEMYERSRAAYHAIAKELGIRLLPVGDAFWSVSTDRRFAYKPDADFDFSNAAAGTLPDQTHSLHVGYFWKQGGDALSFDSHHANKAGEFLGSLVWYGVLFDASPKKVKFTPEGMDADFGKALKREAGRACK